MTVQFVNHDIFFVEMTSTATATTTPTTACKVEPKTTSDDRFSDNAVYNHTRLAREPLRRVVVALTSGGI
eukprot:3508793-Amphidinium_carterae.1